MFLSHGAYYDQFRDSHVTTKLRVYNEEMIDYSSGVGAVFWTFVLEFVIQ
jgi:hypothetical protein